MAPTSPAELGYEKVMIERRFEEQKFVDVRCKECGLGEIEKLIISPATGKVLLS